MGHLSNANLPWLRCLRRAELARRPQLGWLFPIPARDDWPVLSREGASLPHRQQP